MGTEQLGAGRAGVQALLHGELSRRVVCRLCGRAAGHERGPGEGLHRFFCWLLCVGDVNCSVPQGVRLVKAAPKTCGGLLIPATEAVECLLLLSHCH